MPLDNLRTAAVKTAKEAIEQLFNDFSNTFSDEDDPQSANQNQAMIDIVRCIFVHSDIIYI